MRCAPFAASLPDGAEGLLDAAAGWLFVDGQPYALTPLPPFQRAIIATGGLIPYIRAYGRFPEEGVAERQEAPV